MRVHVSPSVPQSLVEMKHNNDPENTSRCSSGPVKVQIRPQPVLLRVHKRAVHK